MNLIPAHGRDYTSKDAVEADWYGLKDFRISDVSHPDDGRYTSAADAKEGERIQIRHNRLEHVHVFRHKGIPKS